MTKNEARRKIVIVGAAGRDFHNFNVAYRDDPTVEVVAFTATQIPGIDDRVYPPALAGEAYPNGIPIVGATELETLIRQLTVDDVVFAYSDVTHQQVMHEASRVLAAGASFTLLGPDRTMLPAHRPVIAFSALRTGCGKSQTARWVAQRLKRQGANVAAIRHPMPYGDLTRQDVQRFARVEDLLAADCTIEEREEYEPHIEVGTVVFAGADYAAVLAAAEAESDVVIWDGGNNDFPFIRPDLHVVLADALRPDQIDTHYPGEAVLRMADIVVLAKANSAEPEDVACATENILAIRPDVRIIKAASAVRVDGEPDLSGKRVLVVEDGPTVTHGGMPFGAGLVAMRDRPDVEVVDPRLTAAPMIADVYAQYPHIGPVLPAVGYGTAQRQALSETINASEADVVIAGTPVDLAKILDLQKPVVRVRYDYDEIEEDGLGAVVDGFWQRHREIGST